MGKEKARQPGASYSIGGRRWLLGNLVAAHGPEGGAESAEQLDAGSGEEGKLGEGVRAGAHGTRAATTVRSRARRQCAVRRRGSARAEAAELGARALGELGGRGSSWPGCAVREEGQKGRWAGPKPTRD